MAPMSLMTFAEARPWAKSIKARVSDRQMPTWQIDRTVGIQKFKNDRSLTDDQVELITRWVEAGAPQGDPKDMPPAKQWPDGQGWNFAAQFGQTEPDLIIKSYDFTMPKVSQDVWDKRVTPSGITEPRWVRAIEIRPETLPGRRITHHAIAYLEQTEPGAPGAPGLPAPFMEWAVGKQGEMMRPDTGKLLLPGSKFHWDIHYSQAGEEITSKVEMGIYFYPKGQEPKFRTSLSLVPAALGLLDIRPNTVVVEEGFRSDHQQGGDGHLLLPEGAGAEVPHVAVARARGARSARHPSEHRRGRGRLQIGSPARWRWASTSTRRGRSRSSARRCRSCPRRSVCSTSVRTPSWSRKASRRSARRRASTASRRTCTCAARR